MSRNILINRNRAEIEVESPNNYSDGAMAFYNSVCLTIVVVGFLSQSSSTHPTSRIAIGVKVCLIF